MSEYDKLIEFFQGISTLDVSEPMTAEELGKLAKVEVPYFVAGTTITEALSLLRR